MKISIQKLSRSIHLICFVYQGTLAECMYINTKKTLEITTIKGPLHINYSIRFEQWTGVCSGRVLLFRNKLSS